MIVSNLTAAPMATVSRPRRSRREENLPLVDRQIAFVQLQHDQVTCRYIDGMNLALPEAGRALLADDSVVQTIPKRFPKLIALAIGFAGERVRERGMKSVEVWEASMQP
jgi:hypothetical protein